MPSRHNFVSLPPPRKPLASMTHPRDRAHMALNVSGMLCEGQGRALGPGGAGQEGDKKTQLVGSVTHI